MRPYRQPPASARVPGQQRQELGLWIKSASWRRRLIDLARLNRIVGFDEDLAYVTLEPGVTQRQLHRFLTDRRSKLWMDATGASPDCSIIGNTMERGFGHTPMGDHCGAACGLEVVLPDGSFLRTGFGRFEGPHTTPVGRYGVGPSLDGLFAQSNLGIVTQMSVWLMPGPSISRHSSSSATRRTVFHTSSTPCGPCA